MRCFGLFCRRCSTLRMSTIEPKILCRAASKTGRMKSKNSGTRSVTLPVYRGRGEVWRRVDTWFVCLPADKQDSQQQQPNRAGESTPPADGDADPEADHAGGPGDGEELPGLSAGASGAAAEKRSGGAERRASHQHERRRGAGYEKLDVSLLVLVIFRQVFNIWFSLVRSTTKKHTCALQWPGESRSVWQSTQGSQHYWPLQVNLPRSLQAVFKHNFCVLIT